MNTSADQKRVRVAILVNPMSGRDVRRLAARATNMTHEAKRDIVARIAAGAHAMGATDLYVAKEPFNIAAAALEYLGLSVRCHVLDNRVTNTAADTEANLLGFLRAGCRVIVSLGGDGTNRAIVRGLRKAAGTCPGSGGCTSHCPVYGHQQCLSGTRRADHRRHGGRTAGFRRSRCSGCAAALQGAACQRQARIGYGT